MFIGIYYCCIITAICIEQYCALLCQQSAWFFGPWGAVSVLAIPIDVMSPVLDRPMSLPTAIPKTGSHQFAQCDPSDH
jgi:hypothetical protein